MMEGHQSAGGSSSGAAPIWTTCGLSGQPAKSKVMSKDMRCAFHRVRYYQGTDRTSCLFDKTASYRCVEHTKRGAATCPFAAFMEKPYTKPDRDVAQKDSKVYGAAAIRDYMSSVLKAKEIEAATMRSAADAREEAETSLKRQHAEHVSQLEEQVNSSKRAAVEKDKQIEAVERLLVAQKGLVTKAKTRLEKEKEARSRAETSAKQTAAAEASAAADAAQSVSVFNKAGVVERAIEMGRRTYELSNGTESEAMVEHYRAVDQIKSEIESSGIPTHNIHHYLLPHHCLLLLLYSALVDANG